jgi:di/tricarboxylate transporter
VTDWLAAHHLGGIVIGISTFLIIGIFHPVVIQAEYHWGKRCWWVFLVLGVVGLAAALWVENLLVSSLLGVFAFSSFWSIKEVVEQHERVRKGWFPMNPKRKQEYE